MGLAELLKDAIKTNGAAGWDDITPQIFKMIHHSVNHPLVYMTNLSLQQGIFRRS